jgi:aminoglycoside phosphotransferase (APT) family kinase protein
MTAEASSTPGSPHDLDRQWVVDVAGGDVLRFERLPGGGQRTTTLVDVRDKRGELLELILQRSATGPYSGTSISNMEREASVFRALNGSAVKAPKLYAVNSDGAAMLTERAPGSGDFASVSDRSQRDAITLSFVEQIAALHALDVRKMQLIALDVSIPASELALRRVAVWQELLDRFVRRPIPIVRVALDWLRRNAPTDATRVALCHGDLGPGNFLFEKQAVTAVLDWELTHIGDIHDDLAMLALRGFQINDMGSLSAALTHYERVSGTTVDPNRVRYYRLVALVLGVVTSLVQLDRQQVARVAMPLYAHLVPTLQYLIAQALLECTGLRVDPPEPIAEAEDVPERENFDLVLEDLNGRRTGNGLSSVDVVSHLRARALFGRAADEAELADLEQLLGSRPRSVQAGHRAVEAETAKLPPDKLLRWAYRSTRRAVDLWPAWAAVNARLLKPIEL